MEGSMVKHVCYPCKRRFPTSEHLRRHEKLSENHKRSLEKREEKMRKRKKELVLAARNLRHQIFESDEALQQQPVASEMMQAQRMLLEMQLQQILGEYGQAQEFLENGRLAREAEAQGIERPSNVRETKVGKLALTAGVACWQSNKEVQEDRFILDIQLQSPEGHDVAGFAVLDGHSGSLCVDHVVERLPVHLQKCLKTKGRLTDDSLSQAVQEACAATDEEFLQRARQMEILDGSTMILTLVYPQVEAGRATGSCRLLVACVGDSRAVLCQSTCEQGVQSLVAAPLSEDHKPNRPDEKARVENKGGIVDFEGAWRVFMPGPAKFGGQHIARWGLAVSRAFGDLLLKEAENYDCAGVLPGGLICSEPEIRILDLDPSTDRFVVMASDGVWDVFTSQDAVAVCAAQASPEIAAQLLLRRTYAASSEDNMTALVLSWSVENDK